MTFALLRVFGLPVIALLSSAAQAREPHIRYTASEGCPSEQDFIRDLEALRSTPSTTADVSVDVVVTQLDAGAVARVRFVDDRGIESVRELSAKDCAEVASAAALVVIVALDARASAIDSVPARPAVREPPPTPPPLAPHDRVRSDSGSGEVAWQAGGGAVLELTFAPDPLLGPAAFLGLGAVEPSWDVRAYFVYLSSGIVVRGDQRAEFGLIGGRLDGCALPLLRSARLLLHPCLAVEAGAEQSRGIASERYTSQGHSELRAAGGPLVRGRVLFGQLAIEAYGGPWISLAGSRRFFFREPTGESAFYDVPRAGWLAGVGFALTTELSVISRGPSRY